MAAVIGIILFPSVIHPRLSIIFFTCIHEYGLDIRFCRDKYEFVMISKPAKQLIFDIALIRGEELFHNLDYFQEKEYQYAKSDKKELNLFCC